MDERLHNALESPLGLAEIQGVSEYLICHPDAIPALYRCLPAASPACLKNIGWALMHVAKRDVSALYPSRQLCYEAVMRYRDERVLRNLLFVANALFGQSDSTEIASRFELYDRCLAIVSSGCFSPGTRSNALSLVAHFCHIEPGLSQEVKAVLASLSDFASPGLKCKMLKVLKELESQHAAHKTKKQAPRSS